MQVDCRRIAGDGARMRVFDLVGAVDDHDDVVIEIGLQPIADALIDPCGS